MLLEFGGGNLDSVTCDLQLLDFLLFNFSYSTVKKICVLSSYGVT